MKIILYAQGERLKKIFFRDGKSVGECLYFRVKDTRKIQKINDRSVNWRVRGLSETYGYIILEQRDAYEKLTGYCKIKKDPAITTIDKLWGMMKVWAKYPDRDWLYYERRG